MQIIRLSPVFCTKSSMRVENGVLHYANESPAEMNEYAGAALMAVAALHSVNAVQLTFSLHRHP
jgi:hypothetical protein